jgi:hypothetical protein
MSTHAHYVGGRSTHPVNHIVFSKKYSEGISGQTRPRSHVSGIPQLLNWLPGVGVHNFRCWGHWWYSIHLDVESERRPIVPNRIGVYLDLASEKIANFPDQKLAGVIHHL